MANACSQHCQLISQSSPNGAARPFNGLQEQHILDNILCTFVSTIAELLAAVESLKQIVSSNPNVSPGNTWYICIKIMVLNNFVFIDLDSSGCDRFLFFSLPPRN